MHVSYFTKADVCISVQETGLGKAATPIDFFF